MVALLVSLALTIGPTLLLLPLARRRPIGTPLSWGEAMFAATASFGIMFMAYGVVPHQWLTMAGNEWNWRADRIVAGPGELLEKLPFTITYLTLQDIVVTLIYIVFLGLQMWLHMWWQQRGREKAPAIGPATSTFGRPLSRRA